MLRNYLKIAWRNILRDKIFSTINILGLAMGLTVTLSIIQYARFELSYEDTHQFADRVVRITMQYMNDDVVTYEDSETYRPLGPMIKSQFPEVEDMHRSEQRIAP